MVQDAALQQTLIKKKKKHLGGLRAAMSGTLDTQDIIFSHENAGFCHEFRSSLI